MNLRDQSGDNETRLLKESLVIPPRVALFQPIAHGVVLEREETMKEAQPHPAVLGHPGNLEPRDRIDRKSTIGADLDLAVLPGANGFLRRSTRAIHLRSVPPVRVLVDVGRRARRTSDLRWIDGRN